MISANHFLKTPHINLKLSIDIINSFISFFSVFAGNTNFIFETKLIYLMLICKLYL